MTFRAGGAASCAPWSMSASNFLSLPLKQDSRKTFACKLCLLARRVDKFYAACDPDRENLSLYGNPDGTWEVTLPAEEVPPEMPEPALGINFARNGMQASTLSTRPLHHTSTKARPAGGSQSSWLCWGTKEDRSSRFPT